MTRLRRGSDEPARVCHELDVLETAIAHIDDLAWKESAQSAYRTVRETIEELREWGRDLEDAVEDVKNLECDAEDPDDSLDFQMKMDLVREHIGKYSYMELMELFQDTPFKRKGAPMFRKILEISYVLALMVIVSLAWFAAGLLAWIEVKANERTQKANGRPGGRPIAGTKY